LSVGGDCEAVGNVAPVLFASSCVEKLARSSRDARSGSGVKSMHQLGPIATPVVVIAVEYEVRHGAADPIFGSPGECPVERGEYWDWGCDDICGHPELRRRVQVSGRRDGSVASAKTK
jgi:hypothetical protein